MLVPGRYVGAEEEEYDPEEFKQKMKRITSKLSEQMQQSQKLDQDIKKNLAGVGFKV